MSVNLLNELIFIVAAAFIGGFFARSLNLPSILGYILSGVVFGIVGKNVFESYSSLVYISQIGITLLLFTLGLEVSVESLKKINKKILLIGLLQIILCTVALAPIIMLFGLDLKFALLMGTIFSFSSTAVIVKILEEKGFLNDFPGNNVFVMLLVQDLFVVPVIFFLPILFSNNALSLSMISDFLFTLVKSFLIFIGIFFASKIFLSKLLNILFRYPSHELTTLATIFIAAVSIGALSGIGLPQSIAAFFAGVLISEEGKNLAPLSEIRPLRDILLVLFFVLTGMLINFSYVLNNIAFLILISLVILFVKYITLYIILRLFRYHNSSSVFISSYICNIGEFAVVVGQIAFVSKYINTDQYNIILSVFIFSLLLIPFWIKHFVRIEKRLMKLPFLKTKSGNDVEQNSFSYLTLDNHVVICGHGRVGKQVRYLLDLSNISYIVIDFNRKIISELRNLGKPAIYGDPTDHEVLKSAFLENARVLVIAVPDSYSQRKIINAALSINPKLYILCRSHIEEDRYDLINLGVNSIIYPEFEAGARIGREVLEAFNINNEELSSFIRQLRKNHIIE